MRCRRSPLQFQNTMVGLAEGLLAIQRVGGAKDRVEPGCGGHRRRKSKERGEAIQYVVQSGGDRGKCLLQLF